MNYGGTQFPSWLCDNSLSNVVSLRLEDCKYCQLLPSLGILPFLKELTIEGLDGIVGIGAEFHGSISSSFTSLETLEFLDMKEWEEWECKVAFPRLQRLYISKCPKLKGLSEQLVHVKNLEIRQCGRLTISRHSIQSSSLESLSVVGCPNMNIAMSGCYNFLALLDINGDFDSLKTIHLDFFPKLCTLRLSQCRNLQMISQEHIHNHLEHLTINNCPRFESFPSDGLSAPRLVEFGIRELDNLKLLPKCMHILLPSLTGLGISSCPQVELFSDGGLPSHLKRICLSNCAKLIASLKGALEANTSLEFFSIGGVDAESFPDEGFLPLSLTSLGIYNCQNLKKLDYKGLCHLSSLETLVLGWCPNLQCLPEEGLPKSISNLGIHSCPLLKQRCQKPEGEDWGKIAHIEKLEI